MFLFSTAPKRRTALALLAVTSLFGAPLFAAEPAASTPAPDETTFLDEITVSTTRSSREVAEVPGAVAVIDRAAIDESLATDARDLLLFVPGVEVAGEPTRLGLNGFTVRGIGGNRVLTRVDGVPTAEQFDFGPVSVTRAFLDLDAVESVEIVKSAGSSLYGSAALGGVVSVVTRDPADLLHGGPSYLGLRVGYDGRDQGTDAGLSTAFERGNLQGSLVVSHGEGSERENQGSRETFDARRTVANPQDRRGDQVLGKLLCGTADGGRWKLAVEGAEARTQTDLFTLQGVVGTANTTNFDADDRTERQRVSLERSLVGRRFGLFDTLLARVFGQSAETEQKTLEARAVTLSTGIRSSSRAGILRFEQDSLGGELQLSRELAGKGLLTYGVTLVEDRFDQLRDRVEVNVATGAIIPSALVVPTKYFPESSVRTWGAYAQAEISAANGRLSIVPGVRFDRYELNADQNDPLFLSGNPGTLPPVDLSDQAISPRLGLIWSLGSEQRLAFQYARGFRAPPYSSVNNGFTNFSQGYTTLPNPDLSPETSDSFELGWRLSARRSALAVTLFDNRYADFIDTVTVGIDPNSGLILFQPQNLARVRIRGAELNGEVSWRSLKFRAAVATADGEDKDTGRALNSVPPAKGVLGIGYREAQGRFGVDLNWTVVGAKGDVDRTIVAQFAPDSYQRLDLFATWTPRERLSFQIGLLNAFDETYWEWAEIQGLSATSSVLDRCTSPGRSISAAIRVRR
ncbi:MAG TPA: TonB-dependent hemoglobin/transferrin/lactoferrin family receptor [Thermoanaerobaculia bacterium]|jgi:hemoglobin/transferrin/lactoferrin receptor protein|nr:TonB-dependent hemoglobin/transferrin/lactoferrin family receptor [Thermoanaerobaculia bacterium]